MGSRVVLRHLFGLSWMYVAVAAVLLMWGLGGAKLGDLCLRQKPFVAEKLPNTFAWCFRAKDLTNRNSALGSRQNICSLCELT